MRTYRVVGLSFLALASAAAAATPRHSQAEDAAAELVKTLTGGTAQVEAYFKGPGGLIGLVVRNETERNLAYATPDGHYLVQGGVMDSEGVNQIALAAQKLKVAPGSLTDVRNGDGSFTVPMDLAQKIIALKADQQGTGNRDLFVLSDPLCGYCRHAREVMTQPENIRSIKAHWILTSVIGGEQSYRLVSDYLDGKITFDQAMAAPRVTAGEPADIPDANRQAIEGIRTLLSQATPGHLAVPAVMYRVGDQWRIKAGFNPADFVPKG